MDRRRPARRRGRPVGARAGDPAKFDDAGAHPNDGQPADPLVGGGCEQGHDRAHREADEVDPGDGQSVNQLGQVAGHPGLPVGAGLAWLVGAAMATGVGSDDGAVGGGQRGHNAGLDPVPGRIAGEPMVQYQWGKCAWAIPHLVDDPDTVIRHEPRHRSSKSGV